METGKGKGKRKSFTVEQKVEIIKLVVDKKEHQSDVAKKFGLSATTVNGFITKRDKILEEWNRGCIAKKKFRSPESYALDTALLQWFTTQRANNVPLSQVLLIEKAKQLAEQLRIEDFKASSGYIDRFKKRNGIIFRSIQGESQSVDQDACRNWLDTVLPREIAGYDPKDVFNADETALFFRALPERTLALKGDKCKGGKQVKQRITLLLFANMDGTERIKPIVIGRSNKPRCFAHVDLARLGIDYYNNRKAWMTSELWQRIIVTFDRAMHAANRRVLLVVDNASSHVLNATLQLQAVTIKHLPPNATSVLQPLDQGVIRSVKVAYRTNLIRRLLAHLDAGRATQKFQFTLLDACRVLHAVWLACKNDTIANAFRKAGFVGAAEIVPVEQPRINELGEIDNLFDALNRFLGDKNATTDIADYVNIDADVATEGEFVFIPPMAATTNDSGASDTDEINQENPQPRATFAEAYKGLAALKSYCSEDIDLSALIYEVEDKLVRLRVQSMVQTDIRTFVRPPTTLVEPASLEEIAPAAIHNELPIEPTVCWVCDRECDGAHSCLSCRRPVHAICGEHEPDAEGFGQPVTCRKCAVLAETTNTR